MTLKKSMISIAAAGVIAATITGCGSSGGSSSNKAASTAQPTSITATDGYVYNYTVTATYSDGNESNRTYSTTAVLTDAVSMTTKDAGQAQVAGSATMNLKGVLTDEQLDNLQYVTIARAPQTTDGTTITYATFFDANGDGLFDTAAGDSLVPAGFTMKAPAGFKMITPLTTLVQDRIDTLTASDVNDSNRSEKAALALSQIASALGLTADKIKNVDPMDTVETDPAYALINAMVGQLINDGETAAVANSLATATAATTVSAALNNIAAGATTSKAFFTDAADQLAADADMINAVSSWNLDALRGVNGAAATAFNPTNLTAGTADINVTGIDLSGTAASTLAGSGAKVLETELDDIGVELETSDDVNVSNKAFKLVIDLRAQEKYIAADANVSSLTVVVPFELNSTIDASKVIDGKISGNIIWNGVDGNGNTFTGEMNATEFASRAGSDTVDVVSDELEIMAHTILTTVDTNASNKVGVADLDASIANVKIAIVDSSSALQKTNAAGTASAYWGNTAIASVYGGIVETGKTILKNALLDGRSGNTASPAVNSAPAHALTVANIVTGSGTTAAPYIINNNDAITLELAADGSADNAEENTTVTITASSTDLDLNTSTIIAEIKNNPSSASTTAAGSEFNTTSTVAGDLNYTITTVATDEFGESNTTTYYITANRAPVKATFAEYNTSAITIATDVDKSTMSLSALTASDVGSAIVGRSLDVNVSSIVSIAGKLVLDFNSTITGLDINISNSTDVNDTHGLSATMGDLNITL